MSDQEVQVGESTDDVDSVEALFQNQDPDEATGTDTDGTGRRSHGNWLTTGIDALDRYFNGGIPPGRLVTFTAPPNTQGELFVKQIAAQHDSLYLTSLRPEWEVEETVRDHIQQQGMTGGGSVFTEVRYLDPDARLGDARHFIDFVDDQSVIVIDSIDELEKEPEADYVEFIHDVKRELWDSGSVGLLNSFETDSPHPCRRVTLRVSDIIWELQRTVQAGGVEYLLLVSKFRGGPALTEPAKLELTDEIKIDTSRDIA